MAPKRGSQKDGGSQTGRGGRGRGAPPAQQGGEAPAAQQPHVGRGAQARPAQQMYVARGSQPVQQHGGGAAALPQVYVGRGAQPPQQVYVARGAQPPQQHGGGAAAPPQQGQGAAALPQVYVGRGAQAPQQVYVARGAQPPQQHGGGAAAPPQPHVAIGRGATAPPQQGPGAGIQFGNISLQDLEFEPAPPQQGPGAQMLAAQAIMAQLAAAPPQGPGPGGPQYYDPANPAQAVVGAQTAAQATAEAQAYAAVVHTEPHSRDIAYGPGAWHGVSWNDASSRNRDLQQIDYVVVHYPRKAPARRPELVKQESLKVRDEQWKRLEMRGGSAMFKNESDPLRVDRHTMEWWAQNHEAGFDAIIPERKPTAVQLSQYAYGPIKVDCNYFKLQYIPGNEDAIFNYAVKWEPWEIKAMNVARQYKWKIFNEVNVLAKKATNTSFGLGIWDRGTTIHRPQRIPDDVLPKVARLPFQYFVPRASICRSEQPTQQWPLKKRNINMILESGSDGNPQLQVIRWQSINNYLANGGDYTTTRPLLGAFNNILQGYFLDDYTNIEDIKNRRMFFQGNNEDLAFRNTRITDPKLQAIRDLIILRRGSHWTCRLLPGGVYVNVYSSLSAFWAPNLGLRAVVDGLCAGGYLGQSQVAQSLEGRSLENNSMTTQELNLLVESLKYVRIKTKLINKKTLAVKHPDAPDRWFKIWGFSTTLQRSLRVQRYEWPVDRWLTNPANYPRHRTYYVKFQELCKELYGLQCFQNMRTNYIAVKVDQFWDFYLPLDSCEVKADDKIILRSPVGRSLLFSARKLVRDETALERLTDVQKVVQHRETPGNDPHCKAFNISIPSKFLEVAGYQLQLPTIKAFNGTTTTSVMTYQGSWRFKMENGPLSMPDVKSFGFFRARPVSYGECIEWCTSFRTQVVKGLQHFHNTGYWALGRAPVFEEQLSDTNQVENTRNQIRTCLMELRNRADMGGGAWPEIIFLFADKSISAGSYDAFKYELEVKWGFRTQCITMRTFQRKQTNNNQRRDYFHNVLIQLNHKFGCPLVEITEQYFTEPGFMIMGADVTHPDGGTLRHSIAGVVGTNDFPPRTYGARARIQGHREENIYHLDDMVGELVEKYCDGGAKQLGALVFFRDGVADMSYWEILSDEIPKIFDGVETGTGGEGLAKRVKLLLILCTKRHHTRFKRQVDGRNIEPGTVINDLQYPCQSNNFYLCTHEVPMVGVARTTLYHVLVDQIGLTMIEIQQMIYTMTFTWAKGNQTISIAPAVRYPHLVCTRAKLYYTQTRALYPDTLPHPRLKRPYAPLPLGPADSLKDTMYYI